MVGRRLTQALLGLAIMGAAAPLFAEECAPGIVDLRDGATQARFTVEVMDDEEERARGLMERESLDAFAGMLFVYDKAQPVAFWMHNTLIPLDMLFFDETGTLVKLHENAIPLDKTSIYGGDKIRYVLEINGGVGATLGIGPKTEIRSPALDQTLARWKCGE